MTRRKVQGLKCKHSKFKQKSKFKCKSGLTRQSMIPQHRASFHPNVYNSRYFSKCLLDDVK